MFRVINIGENRLDIEVSGKLDKEEMTAALSELFMSAKDIENGKMLFRIKNYSMPTLGAMGVEFSHLPEAFRFIKKFDRAAVLADENWVRKVSEIEGTLIPGLKLKAFDLSHEAAAENWLAN
ncbi:MAG: STAS/SEC14 domain-containing protein [Gammaproteobacteria bacterium]